ncbi:MAG: aminodeoxychorismate/anthranilate synthase component II [Chitinophagales bacterium]
MVLLIDNYDSFTYNLYDYILQLGKSCIVLRNDEKSLKELSALEFTSIVISPGPCRPSSSGITMELIAAYYDKLPILGICLGHQALGEFFGAKLDYADKQMHGKTSRISLDLSAEIFKNLEPEIEVMRYHSLILKNIGSPLKLIAQTASSEVMAIQHEHFPLVGLQFHPESILSPNGLEILANWFNWIESLDA